MKVCKYWNCNIPIYGKHFLCYEHYWDWEDYLIDKCPDCGRHKDVEYEFCKDCHNRRYTANQRTVTKTDNQKYRVEHSKAWEKADKGAEKFFVYILKDSKGKFYVGHARDLRARLSEHRDNKTKSTAGRNMKLEYFEELSSRKSAELREVELKKLLDTNERKIRNMIIEFQDRVREISLS